MRKEKRLDLILTIIQQEQFNKKTTNIGLYGETFLEFIIV